MVSRFVPRISAGNGQVPPSAAYEPYKQGSSDSCTTMTLVRTACRRGKPLTKRLVMSSAHLASNQTTVTIFYLPTELIAMMAGHLCDEDLYTLTRVSHRIASIVFAIYFARKGLLLSPHTNTLGLRNEGFKALDVWRRSPAFSPLKRLACSFSSDPEFAHTQMEHLNRCFDSLPLEPRPFVRSVSLTSIMANSLDDFLALLQRTVTLTGCLYVTLSDVTFKELPRPTTVSHASRRPRKRANGKKSAMVTTYLDVLQHLRLTRFNLSSSQWHNLFSSLSIPRLFSLEIWGSSSMIAIFHFLLRHSDVRELRFIRCSWNDASSLQPHWLKLPFLRTLQGYSYQILSILRSLRSTPVLCELAISSDSTAAPQSEDFIDQVVSSLTLCSGSISLDVQVPNERSMADLTVADARALAAHKLDSNRLPFVEDLRIGFPAAMLDAMFPVCCELWMALFPHLEEARVYKVRPRKVIFGTVLRNKDNTLKIVWDTIIT